VRFISPYSNGYACICAMSKYKKLSHVIYKYDYHIVWAPKDRLRILKGEIKAQEGVTFTYLSIL